MWKGSELAQLSARGVVWDLDGTLLDTLKQLEVVLTEVLRRRHMPVPSPEMFLKNNHGKLRDSIQAMCGIDGALLDEIYHDFIQSEEQHYEQPESLYFADALDLLQRNHAAGLPQVIISNRVHFSDDRLGSPRNLAKRPPLAGVIQAVVCGDDNEFHKPDARVLDTTERALGLKRSDLLVIGDQYVDAELAYNLGAAAVLVARGEAAIPYLERLADGWEENVHIVRDLRDVSVRQSAA